AGSADCTTPIVPAGTLAMPLGTAPYDARVTVAVAGYVNPPNGGAVMLPDAGPPVEAGADAGPTSPDLTSPAPTYATFLHAGMTNWSTTAGWLRVVHLGATSPQPITANNGNWSFVNVPYGGFGTPSGVDSRGYLSVATGFANPSFSEGDVFGADVQPGDFDT